MRFNCIISFLLGRQGLYELIHIHSWKTIIKIFWSENLSDSIIHSLISSSLRGEVPKYTTWNYFFMNFHVYTLLQYWEHCTASYLAGKDGYEYPYDSNLQGHSVLILLWLCSSSGPQERLFAYTPGSPTVRHYCLSAPWAVVLPTHEHTKVSSSGCESRSSLSWNLTGSLCIHLPVPYTHFLQWDASSPA